ncbi:MAG: Hsp20/alpha crystallin family protein [Desulfosarcina sp.]|nr:Hsp20/alpha crystallin family protein [Desulfobacterales bacterium]
MELTRWNRLGDLPVLQDRINRMFNDTFFKGGAANDELTGHSWNPVVDIIDNDESIVIKADLPGVDKKNISIDYKDRVLTLKGERVDDNEIKEENYYKRERVRGSFMRSFTLPASVTADKISADYEEGVLKIEIPKPEEQKPNQITIN